ncbi:FecR family protein [Sphingomonas sp.]|uniref:FecR family protein n=1 Tax=Sphingomonas sp. TaxID=28214 RepID=UPI001B0042EA|nr:FecR family protein [Sphingomonas sp.]MBO9711555.1 FecR domain-containing protein [Sphingomonas sp.]
MRSMILAALACVAIAAPAAAQDVGVATAVRNDVRAKKPGQPLPRPMQLKQRVAINDLVQTGAKSQLQVLLLDKSVFSVGANARVTIDRYVYDPGRGRQFGASVTKGAFRFMSGRPDRGTGSSIRTPVASIGIRGTIVEGAVGQVAVLIGLSEPSIGRRVQSDPETATLIVLRGPGAATQGRTLPGAIDVTAAGRTVSADRPLMAIYVPRAGAAPIGPFRISPQGLMMLQALVFPSVAERLGIRGPADNLGGDPGSVYYPPQDNGPAYPPGYPDGNYPLGRFPPTSAPGLGSTPPTMGPGVGQGPGGYVPNIPTPRAPPPRQRPLTNNSQPAPASNAAPNGQQPNGGGAPGAKAGQAPAGKPAGSPTPQPSPSPTGSPNNPAGGSSLSSAPPPNGKQPPQPGNNNPPADKLPPPKQP